MRACAPEVCAALLALGGCAGGGDAVRRDTDALRAEVRALRERNDELARRVDTLSGTVEVLQARVTRAPGPAPIEAERPSAPVIPADLAVVRVEPRATGPRTPRAAPPLPTAVPISEPDPERLDALARKGGRDLASESDAELKKARARTGPFRARSLEEFAERYPRHPSADNALVEAASAAADGGRDGVACDLARRAAADYPAGDALPDALERLAWCESRRGEREAERRLLERLVTEFPRTPAAERAGTRLATISGRAGETPDGPGRSSP